MKIAQISYHPERDYYYGFDNWGKVFGSTYLTFDQAKEIDLSQFDILWFMPHGASRPEDNDSIVNLSGVFNKCAVVIQDVEGPYYINYLEMIGRHGAVSRFEKSMLAHSYADVILCHTRDYCKFMRLIFPDKNIDQLDFDRPDLSKIPISKDTKRDNIGILRRGYVINKVIADALCIEYDMPLLDLYCATGQKNSYQE